MEGGAGSPSLEEVKQAAPGRGQWGFWKVPDDVAGPRDAILFPRSTEYFDYEGEAAIIIGQRGKIISADRLDAYVWGVTLLNDWSKRDGMGNPRAMSYNLAKNFDGSTSMGPCIVVGELQADNVEVQTSVIGRYRRRDRRR
ncbi:MAG: fumarylacetoacetate hydrolase family protein [Chloroflexi bacterium]|nr:fumarylacetoacetate hydrolase family protein [Chloroflexota bacterium]